jgi:hypothetical protein
MSRYHVGETEQFYIDPDLVITDAEWVESQPSLRARVAHWRAARFGVTETDGERARILFEYFPPDRLTYLNAANGRLPSGSDGVWARGIWTSLTWGRPRGTWNP